MTFGNAATPAASNERRTYRRIAELGRGGMATVHLAAMQGSHGVTKLVVVKELRPELAVNDEFVVMFFDEARLAARLNHPNIVQSYEVGEENGRQFIVMEYLEGQPLHRVWNKLQAAGKMTLAVNLQVVSDVLAGLDYAHDLADFNGSQLKIVHRDVSPHNVFVTYTGDVKVVDFGIAKAADSSTQTRVGTLKGKLTYMPPEQAMGEKVDRRADLFAVGVLLWESSAGRRLWQGLNDGAIMRALMTGEIPSLLTVNPDLPPRLDEICRKALAPKRDDRYATAHDFQRDVDDLMRETGARASRRDLGILVAELFADDRAVIRATIDDALNRGDPNAVETVVGFHPKPRRPPNAMYASGSQSAIPAGQLANPAGPSGSFVAFAHTGESSHVSQVSQVHQTGQMVSGHTNTGASVAVAQPQKKGMVNLISVLGIAVAIAVGAAFAVYGDRLLGTNASQPNGTAPVQSNGAPLGNTPQGSPTGGSTGVVGTTQTSGIVGGVVPATGTVQLSVTVQPTGALVFLDGNLLQITPQGVNLPRDSRPHKLRAQATGFATKEQDLTLDHDQSIDIVLVKGGAGGGGGAHHAGGKPPSGAHDSTPDLGY
jgi:serine/threonine protein kinase